MKATIILILASSLMFSSCKKESANCGLACNYEKGLLFQTGFEGTTLSDEKYSKVNFAGTDNTLTDKNSWVSFVDNPQIGLVEVSYEDGKQADRIAEIVTDPENPENSVLKFQIFSPHIKEVNKYKGRVQLNVNGNNCLDEIYQTVRLRLDPDMAYLKEWEQPVHWLSVFEFWNNADWTGEKFPFRVTVNLFKSEKGPQSTMSFHAKGDFKNNCKFCRWQGLWDQEATNFDIPFGQWMNIEIYLKEGDKDTGRFYMAVTPEGGEKVVLFDLTTATQHPDEKCPDGFSHFQPMKLYTSDELINYMKDGGKNLAVEWDDWKLYSSKPE